MDWQKLDMSKLSDKALEDISKNGAKTDFSKWDDAELQHLAAADPDSAPKDPSLLERAKPALPIKRGFSDVNWLDAVKQELTKGRPGVVNQSVAANPAVGAALGSVVAAPAAAAAGGAMLRRVVGEIPELAKDAVTLGGGYAVDKMLGTHGEAGIVAAMLRRVLSRGKGGGVPTPGAPTPAAPSPLAPPAMAPPPVPPPSARQIFDPFTKKWIPK